jgi:membrane protease YdiL (CAAX protease family)
MLKKVQTDTILNYLIRFIPPLSIAVVIIGLLLMSMLLKSPDILLRGQYLAFPIILASLIMIYCKPKYFEHKEIIKLDIHISRWNYHLIYLLLYLVTIYLLFAYQTRPIAYFLLIGAMAVVILAEILTND